MELALGFVEKMFTAGAAPVVTGAAPVVQAAGGFTLKSLLQGTATVLGVVQSINAGKADAEAAELAAQDAEREKPLETLQGIARKTSIKQAMMDQIGQQDVAYAASGVDLSFGTPGQARKEAFRQSDLSTETDIGTEQTRIARLDERAANYRKRAARAKKAGFMDGFSIGLKGAASIADRY